MYDQFYTKPEIAKKCIDFLDGYYSLKKFDKIIEPSVGTGSFYDLLPKNKIGIEIDKKLCDNKKYINMSFFDYDNFNEDSILVIGNPPFGTQNKLSVDFFNHAANFAEIIAFIVPKTWKKPNIQNRLNEMFELIYSIDLPKDCFYGNKKTAVKCCFQIWKQTSIPRKKIILQKTHKDWQFLNYIKKDKELYPPENADFVILAYGSGSGKIDENLYRWRPKSVHFIKANIDKEELIKRFKTINFDIANDSSRQDSLGRGLLVDIYSNKYGR